MKKILTAALIMSLLVFTLGNVALADHVEDVQPEYIADFRPGSVPAAASLPDSASQVLHAGVLAMLHHDLDSFAAGDSLTDWETLYNLLSLYGQLDSRVEYRGEDLLFPAETVADYAAALGLDAAALGEVPDALSDRLTRLPGEDCYLAACGNDELAELQIHTQEGTGTVAITGALVYRVDNTPLARFQAVFQTAENLFGFTLVSLELL